MIKHILVPASGLGFDANLLTDAFKLASPFSAHVDVLHVRWEPRRDLPFYGEGFPLEMLDTLMHEMERSAQQISSALRSSRQTSRVARGQLFCFGGQAGGTDGRRGAGRDSHGNECRTVGHGRLRAQPSPRDRSGRSDAAHAQSSDRLPGTAGPLTGRD